MPFRSIDPPSRHVSSTWIPFPQRPTRKWYVRHYFLPTKNIFMTRKTPTIGRFRLFGIVIWSAQHSIPRTIAITTRMLWSRRRKRLPIIVRFDIRSSRIDLPNREQSYEPASEVHGSPDSSLVWFFRHETIEKNMEQKYPTEAILPNKQHPEFPKPMKNWKIKNGIRM